MALWDDQQKVVAVTLMLADANPLMLTAMSEIFEKDRRFSLVATAATAEGFLGMVMRMPVQVGVIDWNLPALGGARLIDVLRAQANDSSGEGGGGFQCCWTNAYVKVTVK